VTGRKCIFCGELLTGNREKEHVIPQWLLDHLGIRDTELFLAVAKSEDDSITESRRHVADEFVEGRVCGGCNSGWMSRLENESKSLLISLIDGHSSLLRIKIEERILVARWAAKTAYALSHATPLRKATDASHLRFVMNNLAKLPTGVGVFAQQTNPTRNFGNFQRNRWPVFSNVPGGGPPPEGSYKIALEFRHLLLLVAYWAKPTADFLLVAGVHIPLWPVRDWYPAYSKPLESQASFSGQESVLDRFSTCLAIVNTETAEVA
jgi:hypothetical protein